MEELFHWLFLAVCCDVLRWPVRCLPTLSPGLVQELAEVPAQVVSRSSPCSATCGPGTRVQELCWLDAQGASRDCRERQVPCVLTRQCALSTQTVEVGGRVELDCLGTLKFSTVRYRYIFSWRFARGVITTQGPLFERWRAPRIDRVILDPVQESDAGTYWCDLKDASHRMLKQVYFGVRVLPKRWVNLESATLHQRSGSNGKSFNDTAAVPLYSRSTMKEVAVYSLSISIASALLTFLVLCWQRRHTGVPHASREARSGTSTPGYGPETSDAL
ncbi:transmembrane protein 81 [Scleropages formosus]|nr:transmembrane protein 81 [Scleropages formosus]